MWNIIIGLVFLIGGLSGKLALRGTNSSPALVVIGFGLLIWGVVQIVRSRSAGEEVEPGTDQEKDESEP